MYPKSRKSIVNCPKLCIRIEAVMHLLSTILLRHIKRLLTTNHVKIGKNSATPTARKVSFFTEIFILIFVIRSYDIWNRAT